MTDNPIRRYYVVPVVIAIVTIVYFLTSGIADLPYLP